MTAAVSSRPVHICPHFLLQNIILKEINGDGEMEIPRQTVAVC